MKTQDKLMQQLQFLIFQWECRQTYKTIDWFDIENEIKGIENKIKMILSKIKEAERDDE